MVFLGFALFSSSRREDFFSFEKAAHSNECALVMKPGKWESLLSQMRGYIISIGRKPSLFKSFFFYLVISRRCEVDQLDLGIET